MLCDRCLDLARSILQLSDRNSKTWNKWEAAKWIRMRDNRWKFLYASNLEDLRPSAETGCMICQHLYQPVAARGEQLAGSF